MASTTATRGADPAPSIDPPGHPPPGGRPSGRGVTLHLAEMVVAMALGMVVLHPAQMILLDAVGGASLLHGAYTGPLVMATNMTLAMSGWMRSRGHGWRSIGRMGAAMYLPFLVLFVPFTLDVVGTGALLLWGHLLMLPAMAGAMRLRPHR